MNILPHKSWHVRTKANIAKVRKDQAQAAEEEKEQQRKIALADQEVRIGILRQRANASKPVPQPSSGSQPDPVDQDPDERRQEEEIGHRVRNSEHINLFADLDNAAKPNAEYVKEKKDEQEKYEKQIGYLTYLGQDTNEALGKRDWYEKVPVKVDPYERNAKKVEVGLKGKFEQDPLNIMKKHLGPGSSSTATKKWIPPDVVEEVRHDEIKERSKSRSGKHKKHKSKDRVHKSHKSSRRPQESGQIERMRAERLLREQKAQEKVKQLLEARNPTPKLIADAPKVVHRPPKYNSQYNPDLSKQ